MPYRFWRRDWWTRNALRRETVSGFVCIALASAIGWQAVSNVSRTADANQARDIDRHSAVLRQVCDELQHDRLDFRLFVSDLLEGASAATRERVFSRLDTRQPEVRICGVKLFVPEPAPALPTTTTTAVTSTTVAAG